MRQGNIINYPRTKIVTTSLDTEAQSLVRRVFEKLRLHNPVLLGKGGEGLVYEYGANVLKIFPQSPDLHYLQDLELFQRGLANNHFTFLTPEILEVDSADGVTYTVEKRLRGVPMDKKLVDLGTADRQKVFASYYQAIRQVHQIKYPDLPFGQIIKTQESLSDTTWVGFLSALLDQKLRNTKTRMEHLVSDFDTKITHFHELIESQLVSSDRNLVHRDYYHNNVLVGDNLEISAVLDFSAHAVVGDPRMDISSVLTWNEINPVVRPSDYDFLFQLTQQDYGDGIKQTSDIYLMYSAFYFSDMADPSFSVEHLNNDALWKRISA